MVYRLAILGATGLVGQTMRSILEEKNLPLELTMFASSNSAGKTFNFKGEEHTVQELTEEALREGKFDYVLSCLLYTSPSPRDVEESRMPSSA